MSAIYADPYYTSKAKSDTNVAKRKKIDSLFAHLLMYKCAGDYELEWSVRDGTIQEIISTISLIPDGKVDADSIQVGQDIENLFAVTLNVGWHGVCKISWNIDHMGQVEFKLTQKQKFQ